MREATLRRWTNIAPYSPDGHFNISTNRRTHVEGLVSLIEGRIAQGWSPSFLTFQFEQLPGKAGAILHQMRTEIETIYRKLICRVQRFPTTRLGSLNVPLLFSCADLPVFKRTKACASQDVRINEGLHHHGVILLPPRSRLREGLVAHLEQQQQRYLAGSRLASIFAEPMTDNFEKAIRYAFKTVESGRLDYDDSFVVLPRALSEVS
jgi:hypothetical protein